MFGFRVIVIVSIQGDYFKIEYSILIIPESSIVFKNVYFAFFLFFFLNTEKEITADFF